MRKNCLKKFAKNIEICEVNSYIYYTKTQTNMTWTKLHKIEGAPDFISVDTRDFHAIETQKMIEESKKKIISTLKKRFGYGALKKFTRDEIYEYCAKLREKSGGEGDWRFIAFNGGSGEWIKYLRFIRSGENSNGEPLYMGYAGDVENTLTYLSKPIDEIEIDETVLNFIKNE